MVKRVYYRPTILPLEPSDDPGIVHGGSQGTSGNESPYTFDGIDQDTVDLIELWCDDYDLQDMDANGNYVITLDEFNTWWNSLPDDKKPW